MDGPTPHKPGLKLIFGGFNLPDPGLERHTGRCPGKAWGILARSCPALSCTPEAMTASAFHLRCLNHPFPVWVSLVIRVSYHCPSHAQNKPTPFPYAAVSTPRGLGYLHPKSGQRVAKAASSAPGVLHVSGSQPCLRVGISLRPSTPPDLLGPSLSPPPEQQQEGPVTSTANCPQPQLHFLPGKGQSLNLRADPQLGGGERSGRPVTQIPFPSRWAIVPSWPPISPPASCFRAQRKQRFLAVADAMWRLLPFPLL